jgi:hypothetical protein
MSFMGSLAHPRLSGSVRWTAAAVVVAFLFGQVATGVHSLSVRHTRCAEHGELVDLEAHPAVPAAPAGDWSKSLARDGVAAGGALEHGHHHCTLVPQRRDEAVLPHRPAVAGPAPRLSAAAHATADVGPAVRIALLRLAPKHSPPLATTCAGA